LRRIRQLSASWAGFWRIGLADTLSLNPPYIHQLISARQATRKEKQAYENTPF